MCPTTRVVALTLSFEEQNSITNVAYSVYTFKFHYIISFFSIFKMIYQRVKLSFDTLLKIPSFKQLLRQMNGALKGHNFPRRLKKNSPTMKTNLHLTTKQVETRAHQPLEYRSQLKGVKYGTVDCVLLFLSDCFFVSRCQ